MNRLACLDLGVESVCTQFSDLFDDARYDTGLLKAALVASGLVPQGLEGTRAALAELLVPLVGPGRGLEVVSQVNDIPKGSRLPRHQVLGETEVPASSRKALQDELVVVRGGMAANVGPILEMVTEKHLLGDRKAWLARQELLGSFDGIREALRRGDMKTLGTLTTRLFQGPLQEIIPWAIGTS